MQIPPENVLDFVERNLGSGVSREQIANFFVKYDSNQNGGLDRDEFKFMLKTNAPRIRVKSIALKNAFKPTYLIEWVTALRKKERVLPTALFFELSEGLDEYLVDESPVSMFRSGPVPRMYRYLIDTFPFLLDLLCAADDELTQTFQNLVKQLLQARARVGHKGTIATLITDKARAPILYWLVNKATSSDRTTLNAVIRSIVSTNPSWKLPVYEMNCEREVATTLPGQRSLRNIGIASKNFVDTGVFSARGGVDIDQPEHEYDFMRAV